MNDAIVSVEALYGVPNYVFGFVGRGSEQLSNKFMNVTPGDYRFYVCLSIYFIYYMLFSNTFV